MAKRYYAFPDGTTMDLDSTDSYVPTGARKVSKAEFQTLTVETARAKLLALLNPGDTVHPVLAHRSASGMMRTIKFFIPATDHNGKASIRDISGLIGDACGYTFDRDRGGLKVGGCGMDMGFSVVYNLGARLWPKGTPEPHGTRNGLPDSEGGYALNSSWL